MGLFGRKKSYDGPAANELDDMAVTSSVISFIHAAVFMRDRDIEPGGPIPGQRMIERDGRREVQKEMRWVLRVLASDTSSDADFREALTALVASAHIKDLEGLEL